MSRTAAPRRLARAKINLWLHVGARRGDGYHPIHSLMVFADIGDCLSLHRGAEGALRVTGPFASALTSDNLVERARRALAESLPGQVEGFRLTLEKTLPVAAGLGGGSADAAAALVLIRDSLRLPASDAHLAEIAATLGSDVPACLASRAVIAEGRGERLSPAPRLPDLAAVLVNPGAPVSTAATFRAFDEAGAKEELMPPPTAGFADAGALAEYLAATRNDLVLAAERQQPRIGEALGWLQLQPETLFARMSGSGATVWALCANGLDSERLALRLAAAQPRWWVRPCRLQGSR